MWQKINMAPLAKYYSLLYMYSFQNLHKFLAK